MEHSVETTGKTVEEAISLALQELGTDEKSVNIEILDEGNKGIFGLIGNKMAKVKATLKENKREKAEQILTDIFEKMTVRAEIEAGESETQILLKIYGDDVAIIIGRQGDTLNAIQYLLNIMVNRNGEYKKVVIDVENYRQRRDEALVAFANKMADKVVKFKKSITLDPMSPYERRIIHSALQYHKSVKTYSIGEEPNRKVVLTLK